MAKIAVFVSRGKRGWQFRAYSLWFNPEWDGCNIVDVPDSVPRAERKSRAIGIIKARMDITSTLPPTGINVCKERD